MITIRGCKEETKQQVLEFLRAGDGAQTLQVISRAVNFTPSHVSTMLKELIADGKVKRPQFGLYAPAEMDLTRPLPGLSELGVPVMTREAAVAAGLVEITMMVPKRDVLTMRSLVNGLVAGEVECAVVDYGDRGFEVWRDAVGYMAPGMNDKGCRYILLHTELAAQFRAWLKANGFATSVNSQAAAFLREVCQRKWRRPAGVPLPMPKVWTIKKTCAFHFSEPVVKWLESAVCAVGYATIECIFQDIVAGNWTPRAAARKEAA